MQSSRGVLIFQVIFRLILHYLQACGIFLIFCAVAQTIELLSVVSAIFWHRRRNVLWNRLALSYLISVVFCLLVIQKLAMSWNQIFPIHEHFFSANTHVVILLVIDIDDAKNLVRSKRLLGLLLILLILHNWNVFNDTPSLSGFLKKFS